MCKEMPHARTDIEDASVACQVCILLDEVEKIPMNPRQSGRQVSMQVMLDVLIELIERRLIRNVAGVGKTSVPTGHHIVMDCLGKPREQKMLTVQLLRMACATNFTRSHIAYPELYERPCQNRRRNNNWPKKRS